MQPPTIRRVMNLPPNSKQACVYVCYTSLCQALGTFLTKTSEIKMKPVLIRTLTLARSYAHMNTNTHI